MRSYIYNYGVIQIMNTRNKLFLKELIPPFFIKAFKSLMKSGIYFSGPYHSWEEALIHSKGYSSDIILEKVKRAQLKVISGEAAYERDSVLFDKIQYSFPVLAGLLRAANANGGNLSVLDFGGSLGTSYYQCRGFLSELTSLRWSIVEQSKFVECGRKLFETEELKFYHDIDECLTSEKPGVVLLSSILPYIEYPYGLLEDIVARNVKYIILDRTPITGLKVDILTVQKVPKQIYEASYPAWLFSEEKLLGSFANRYEILSDFDSFETWWLGSIRVQNKGYIFLRCPEL